MKPTYICSFCASENIEYQAECNQYINPNEDHPCTVTTQIDWRIKCKKCGATEKRTDIYDYLFSRSPEGERLEMIRKACLDLYHAVKAIQTFEFYGHSAWQDLWQQCDEAIEKAELPYSLEVKK